MILRILAAGLALVSTAGSFAVPTVPPSKVKPVLEPPLRIMFSRTKHGYANEIRKLSGTSFRRHLRASNLGDAAGQATDMWHRWGEDGDVSRWGESLGIWCPWKVIERGGEGGDRTVIALKAHRAGDVICRVPKSAAWEVSASAPPQVPANYIAATYWTSADATSEKKGWYVKLAAKLLYERSLTLDGAEGSAWGAYISLLPLHIDTLVHFTDEQLDDLQNARLARQVREEVAWLKDSHAELLKHMPESSVSFDSWRWALDCVRSRTFKTKDSYCMCPLMDLFNHNSAARTSAMSFDSTLNCYQIVAGASVKEGQEVVISYGPLSNDFLLAFYAFVEVDNPWDTVVMTQERVIHLLHSIQQEEEAFGDEVYELRLKVVAELKRFKYLDHAASCQLLAGPRATDAATASVELAMLLLALTVPLPLLLDQGAAAIALKIGEGVELSKKLASDAYNALSKVASRELDSYPSTIAEDVNLLDRLDSLLTTARAESLGGEGGGVTLWGGGGRGGERPPWE